METIKLLLYGFSINMQISHILACLAGVIFGTITGMLPGLGTSGAMALLLPVSFGMDPAPALIMLAGIYYGGMYGGGITSVLLNLPGEAAAVITSLDGHPMAQKGRAGAALATVSISSFIGGTLAIIGLTFFAPIMSRVALKFGPPEYFAIAVLGFVILSNLTGDDIKKSFLMILVGLMISTIGMDSMTGVSRYTMGIPELMRGVSFSVIAMAVFGIRQVFENIVEPQEEVELHKVSFKDLYPSRKEFTKMVPVIIRGSIIGFFIGLVPGPAGTLASFTSYSVEQRIHENPELFGTGIVEGIAGPEAANNAASTATMIPLLSLGLPFAPPSALLLAGFIVHGITPGPTLISQHPEIFWALIASMYIGNIFLVIINLPLVGVFSSILRTPTNILMPFIMVITFTGAFAINSSSFDIIIVLVMGVFAYLITKAGYNMAPLAIGIVLGGTIETSLIQTMVMLDGNITKIFYRPIAGVLIGLSLILLVFSIFKQLRKK